MTKTSSNCRRIERLERAVAPPRRIFCLFDPRPYVHFDLDAEVQRLQDERAMTAADELRIIRWRGPDEESALGPEARPLPPRPQRELHEAAVAVREVGGRKPGDPCRKAARPSTLAHRG
jgi:hypothetical protein